MSVRVRPPAPNGSYLGDLFVSMKNTAATLKPTSVLTRRAGPGSFTTGNRKPENRQTLKPPLKWAGGKRWLAPHLKQLWNPHSHRRYVEPFCGGLAVAFGLQPEHALLNDINTHLINFYLQIQNGLQITIDVRNDKKLFYDHREQFNKLTKSGQAQSAEAAQLFYFLNRTCFNGLCRFNQSGEFNVPFGSYREINYASDFPAYKTAFSKWTFTSKDLDNLPIEQDDFIYADPPYDVEFTTYSPGGFSWDDQVRTAELLATHMGPVVLSNQATRRVVELYKSLGFKLRLLDAPRRISCTGDRTAAKEILALKGL